MAFVGNPAGFNASAATAALPGVPNNMVGSVGGAIASETAVKTLYDYDPYSILTDVFERHGGSNHIFRFLLKSFGMTRAVDAPLTGHYEADWRQPLIKINALISGTGAGVNVVLELHADSMFAATWTAGGVAANASGVRVGDVIEFGLGLKGRVTSKNTTTNPHRITVTPLRTTTNLAAVGAITVGGSYAIQYNVWGEATGIPDGRIQRIFKYTNTFAITKEGFGASGSAKTGKLFVSFKNAEDGTILGLLKRDAMENFERNASNALLFGESINNVTEANATLGIDVPIPGSEGLWQFATSYGHIPTYTSGAYALTDFDKIGTIYAYERVSAEAVMSMMGITAYTGIENLLLNANVQNYAPFLMKSFADKSNVAPEIMSPFEDPNFTFYVGFKAIHKNGLTFAFRSMPEFTDATLGGAYATKYPTAVLTAPVGMGKNAEGQPSMFWGYEYRGYGGYNRDVKFGQVSGIGASNFINAATTIDYEAAGMLTEQAFHGGCPNQVVLQLAV